MPKPARYALEISRETQGGFVRRDFGPASPQSARTARFMRATIFPWVSAFRPTTRGVKLAQRTMNAPTFPLRGTKVERRTVGGIPVEWTTAPRAKDVDPAIRVVLYIHGGGFVFGTPGTHRNLVSRLSQVLSAPVVSADYRMVPTGSIQTSQRDAVDAYRGLLDEGIPADAILVAGDSAGGNLATHVVLCAAEQGLPKPAGLILLSPWLDLGPGGPSRKTNLHTESFIGGDVLSRIARALVPDERERLDWHNSPINATPAQLAALPPTLIQVGGAEVLLDDGVSFAERIGTAGGNVELQWFEGQGHVVAMWNANPEARRALKEIAVWVRSVFPDHRDPAMPSDETIREAVESGGSTAHSAPGAFPG